MAQLKDTIISGSLRVTDSLFTNNLALLSATASTALVTDANKNIISRGILNNTAIGALGWNSSGNTHADNLRFMTVNTLAYWNGAYSGTSSNLTILGTVTNGVWNATTINPNKGGTGINSYAKGDILYAGSAIASTATTGLSKLALGTAGYFLKATTNGPVWANTTDITALGTITTGTWQSSTKINASYLSSSNTNRLVWTGNDGTFTAANHYVSSTQIGVNTSSVDSNITLQVNGILKATGIYSTGGINLLSSGQVTHIYFNFGTDQGNHLGYLYHLNKLSASDTNITASQMRFVEFSYNQSSNAPSTTSLAKYESYHLPMCDPDRIENAYYDILTTKNYFDVIHGKTVPSGATFDNMLTAGVYSIVNNVSGYPTTSGTNYNYGILIVMPTAAPEGVANNCIQFYLGGASSSANYKLWVRSRYNKTWQGWKQITLT